MSEKVQLKEVSDSIPKNQEIIENSDFQKKLEILNNSYLKEMNGFSSFINYLNQRKSNNSYEEINIVVSLIKNNKIDELIAYFDIDAGKGFFNNDNLFQEFKKDFNIRITSNNYIETKTNNVETKYNNIQGKKITEELKQEKNKEEKVGNTQINIIHIEYNKTISILENHNFDKSTVNKIKDAWGKIDSIKKITSVDQFSEIRKVLEENKDDIIKIIKEDAEETGNTKDLRKIADSFKSLGIIDDKKYAEIYDFADKIDKKGEIQTKSLPETQKELAIGYSSRGDILYKSDDKTSFTIEDGKITSVSKESGFKLTDYSTLDKDGKALTEKMKLEVEIKKLNGDLGDIENKKDLLDLINITIGSKELSSINPLDLNSILYKIEEKAPLLKDTAYGIATKDWKIEDKIKAIIKLIYGNITGSTDTSEINSKEIVYMIFTCNEKLETKNNELNKELQEKQKKLEEFKKIYPNLDEKSIQEKIKSQETKMQDTIKFCDEYGLSSLGHIAYIKQVIREFNKHEVDRKIPEDIGSSTEFLDAFKNDKDGKLTESLKKFMAKLLGKEVKDIYKDGVLGLNTIDKSTPKTGNQVFFYP